MQDFTLYLCSSRNMYCLGIHFSGIDNADNIIDLKSSGFPVNALLEMYINYRKSFLSTFCLISIFKKKGFHHYYSIWIALISWEMEGDSSIVCRSTLFRYFLCLIIHDKHTLVTFRACFEDKWNISLSHSWHFLTCGFNGIFFLWFNNLSVKRAVLTFSLLWDWNGKKSLIFEIIFFLNRGEHFRIKNVFKMILVRGKKM